MARKPYKDPLHVSYEELTVYHNDKPQYMLNKQLLDQQNCWENLNKIKKYHGVKLTTYDAIEKEEDPVKLKQLAQELTITEFKLQSLWGFPEDANFHRFWETPKCSCPVLDNEDRYPHSHIINQSCLLHGV